MADFAYYPIHMVWSPNGFIRKIGMLDLLGIVVHINGYNCIGAIYILDLELNIMKNSNTNALGIT